VSLETLIKEIQVRSQKEVADLEAKLEGERRAIEAASRQEVDRVRADADRRAQAEAARERARLVASAKLQAKKLMFEARERRTAAALEEVKARLVAYARGPDYPALLASMVTAGTSALGNDVRILARPEDVPLLPVRSRGSVDAARPLRTLGGLIIERTDGSRGLNLTFEELLRLREDGVREILGR